MTFEELRGLDIISDLSVEKASVLARIFRHTRMSYKYFWFLGLLDLVCENKSRKFAVSQVMHEMAARAWHPVCYYRLSLGVGDQLEESIRGFHSASALESKSSRQLILKFLSQSEWATERLQRCASYVPTRLLQAHFQPQLSGMPDQQKDGLTIKLAAESQTTSSASMYWLRPTASGHIVEMNDEWNEWMITHGNILRSFAEYQLCQYLQSKNPNIPGIVNKLHAPITRKLETARKYWTDVRAAFSRSGRSDWFVDIYTSRPLTDRFAIDHFLPWSFVAHDLMWNLAPVSSATNSAKADRLPRMKQHLPQLAKLHHRALRIVSLHNKRGACEWLTPYAECFNIDTSSVLKLSEAEFTAKYLQVMEPQERIARFQGFSDFA